MLTNKDLTAIDNLVKNAIEEDDTLARKCDLKHLPTKDEFYEKMDGVMGELKTIREEQAVLSGLTERVNENTEDIQKIRRHLHIHTA